MKYRVLGKTKMRVSVIGIGTAQLGGAWGKQFSQDEVDSMFACAADCGINLIDTAECYGDHVSERLIGQAIKGTRDHWIIATKFGHKWTGLFQDTDHFDPQSVLRQLDDSLKALGTDYVDLYQFHSGRNPHFETPGLWEMLHRQVEAGKIRHLGTSIGGHNIHQVDKSTEVGSEAIQLVYNRLETKPELEILPSCQRQGLGVLARLPLAKGYLTGKYDEAVSFSSTDVRSTFAPEEVRQAIRQSLQLKATEVPADVPMSQWALAWCLQHPAVTAVIPGCKSVKQVEDNAAAAELDMVSLDHPQAVA